MFSPLLTAKSALPLESFQNIFPFAFILGKAGPHLVFGTGSWQSGFLPALSLTRGLALISSCSAALGEALGDLLCHHRPPCASLALPAPGLALCSLANPSGLAGAPGAVLGCPGLSMCGASSPRVIPVGRIQLQGFPCVEDPGPGLLSMGAESNSGGVPVHRIQLQGYP